MNAVTFESVTKRYKRSGAQYSSLREELGRPFRRMLGRSSEASATAAALTDISFEVHEGDSYALIGPNGAGKTTALKLISRISFPSSGRIRVNGRVASLIEVGSGVHPELTGRENIWLYGQILGMSRSDVARRFSDIVEFSELGHVLDRPVKTYSSGMQLRIGFAIASHLEPDIFVVDEALAVGDAGFQTKCVERMSALVRNGHTLLFVSHNLAAVETMCQRGLFLLNGETRSEGPVREVMRSYIDWIENGQQDRMASKTALRQSRQLSLEQVALRDSGGQVRSSFKPGSPVEVVLTFSASADIPTPYFSIGISDGRPDGLVIATTLVDGGTRASVSPGLFEVSCRFDAFPLMPGVYELWASVRGASAYGDIFDWQLIGAVRVEAPYSSTTDAPAEFVTGSPVFAPHSWDFRQ